MTEPDLLVLPTDAWADHVATELADMLAAEPELRLCLPTGSTPRPVYAALPEALHAAGADFSRASVVLLDEYLGLPPGDPARCDSQLHHELLERVDPLPPRVITFAVDGQEPSSAAAEVAAAVREMGGLDLVLLGLGMNGHVGMNEPGTPAGARTRAVELAEATIEAARGYGADPPPTRGVTIGMAEILEAGEVWLLVAGAHKAGILASVLEGGINPQVPATLLREHPRFRVMVDSAAAS